MSKELRNLGILFTSVLGVEVAWIKYMRWKNKEQPDKDDRPRTHK